MVRTRAKKGAAVSRQKDNDNSSDSKEVSEDSWKTWLLDFERECELKCFLSCYCAPLCVAVFYMISKLNYFFLQ